MIDFYEITKIDLAIKGQGQSDKLFENIYTMPSTEVGRQLGFITLITP